MVIEPAQTKLCKADDNLKRLLTAEVALCHAQERINSLGPSPGDLLHYQNFKGTAGLRTALADMLQRTFLKVTNRAVSSLSVFFSSDCHKPWFKPWST
jgi:hypothetical protein